MTLHYLVTAGGPDFGAAGGSSELRRIAGALHTFGLLTAVLMLIVCGATWAVASTKGSWQSASRAKTGLCVALGGAVFTGGALNWANWLIWPRRLALVTRRRDPRRTRRTYKEMGAAPVEGRQAAVGRAWSA